MNASMQIRLTSVVNSRPFAKFAKFFDDSERQTRTFFQIFNNLANGTALALSASIG
jgi:hypothetical protein